jgi:hypothetical protein
MKKVVLSGVLLVSFFASHNAFAQKTENKQTNEIILQSIRPADASPAVFANQAELDEKQGFKIDNIKKQILKNSDNPLKVTMYRKELWRMENAIIHQKK